MIICISFCSKNVTTKHRLTQSGTAELSALDPSVAPGEQGTGQGWPAGSRRRLLLSGLSLEPTQGLAQSPDACLVLDKCSLNCHSTPSARGREWESRSSGTGCPAPAQGRNDLRGTLPTSWALLRVWYTEDKARVTFTTAQPSTSPPRRREYESQQFPPVHPTRTEPGVGGALGRQRSKPVPS